MKKKDKSKQQVEEARPDNSDVFAVLDEENKWERKERKKEEKIKAKEAKKRAKYGGVDDDTYYSMKAHPAHIAFGVMSILLVFVGMAVATLCVYKLAIAPSYATLKDSEENLSIAGLASPGDSSLMQQRPALAGLATSSDALYDTWVEEEYEATATDAEIDAPEELTDEDTASQEAAEE